MALASLKSPLGMYDSIDSIPWAAGGFLPVHSVISADSRDNRRARSAEDGGVCRYDCYLFQHSCISSLFMT